MDGAAAAWAEAAAWAAIAAWAVAAEWAGGGAGGAAGAYYPAGAARFGLLPIPHPIMAADADLNRGVSIAEWDHAAASRFNMLDEMHVGRLTMAELSARRMRTMEGWRGERRPQPQPTPGQPESGVPEQD